jgi:hypothetical protein
MKIYISTLDYQTWATINEQEIKDGAAEKDLTPMSPTITSGLRTETFIPGEWKHVPDDFVIDAKKYPFIKEAHIVMEELTKVALQEKGLDNFAVALEESYTQYEKAVPAIATDVKKYAPVTTAAAIEDVKEG